MHILLFIYVFTNIYWGSLGVIDFNVDAYPWGCLSGAEFPFEIAKQDIDAMPKDAYKQ